MIVPIVAIVVESDTVEFLKGICNFAPGCGKSGVQRDALVPRSADVDALAFLYIAEVRRLDPATLIRDDWRFHVSQQRPRGSTEEGMRLDVRSTGSGSKSAQLIFDE